MRIAVVGTGLVGASFGLAVRAADVPGELPVAGVIAAGAVPDAVLAPGTALKIMTGAPLPRGADTVVMREEVEDLGQDLIRRHMQSSITQQPLSL